MDHSQTFAQRTRTTPGVDRQFAIGIPGSTANTCFDAQQELRNNTVPCTVLRCAFQMNHTWPGENQDSEVGGRRGEKATRGGGTARQSGKKFTATSQLQNQGPDPRVVSGCTHERCGEARRPTGVDKSYGDRTPKKVARKHRATRPGMNGQEGRDRVGKRSDGTGGARGLLSVRAACTPITGRSRAPSNLRKTKTKHNVCGRLYF